MTTRWLVNFQPNRKLDRWRFVALEATDAISLMRAVEVERRKTDDGLYGFVAASYDDGEAPHLRWPEDRPPSEHRAISEQRDAFLRAPERVGFGYRIVFDLDSNGRECWPQVREAALKVREVYARSTGGATLDAYASGGSRCGLHLEGPAELRDPLATFVQCLFVQGIAREAGVPLLAERLTDEKAPVEIDDSILQKKKPCGAVLQAPGIRQTRLPGGATREDGTGKYHLPWEVIERLATPEDYEAEVYRRRRAGQLVPPWLEPLALVSSVNTALAVPPDVFVSLIEEVRVVQAAPPRVAKPRSERQRRRQEIHALVAPEPPPADRFANEAQALDNVRSCCRVIGDCWKRQEEGQKLSRPLWVSFGAALTSIGRLGEEKLRDLDQAVMGETFTPDHADAVVRWARGGNPPRCSTLGALYDRHRRASEPLGCGTPSNPCGFRGNDTPVSHGDALPVQTLNESRPPREVEHEIATRIAEFFENPTPGRTLLVTVEAGVGKTREAIRSIVRTGRRVAYFGPMHKLLKETLKRLKDERAAQGKTKEDISLVRRPKLTAKLCPAGKFVTVSQDYDLGVNPKHSVCERCPYFKGRGGERGDEKCPYIRGTRAVKRAKVGLYASVMLRFGQATFKDVKDRVLILDEDPTPFLSPTLTKTTAEMLDQRRLYQDAIDLAQGRARELLEQRNDLLRDLDNRVRAAQKAKTKIVLVRAKDLDLGKPIRSKRALKNANLYLRRAFWNADGGLRKRGGKRVSAETAFFQGFLDYVWTAKSEGRGDAVVGLIDLTKKPTVVLGYRVALPEYAPVLILDATGQKEHYEALLPGRTVEVVGGYVKNESTLVQYADKSFSTSSLAKSNRPITIETRDYAVTLVKHILTREGANDPLVVTHRKRRKLIRKALGWLPEERRIVHFQALRGQNRYRDRDVAIVLGTPRPPYPVIRFTAASLHGADESDLRDDGKGQKLRYRGCTVRPWGFQNEKLVLASAYHTQAELIQAMGRNRYATSKKKVYILTNEVIDVPGVRVAFARHELGLAPPATMTGRERRLETLVRVVGGYADRGESYSREDLAKRAKIKENSLKNFDADLAAHFQLSYEGQRIRPRRRSL